MRWVLGMRMAVEMEEVGKVILIITNRARQKGLRTKNDERKDVLRNLDEGDEGDVQRGLGNAG